MSICLSVFGCVWVIGNKGIYSKGIKREKKREIEGGREEERERERQGKERVRGGRERGREG